MVNPLRASRVLLNVIYICALNLFSSVRGIFYRFSRKLSVDAESTAQVREKGYLLIENYFSSEQRDRIIAMAEIYMREEYGDFDHINGQSYYRCPIEN